jgi:hypothetical protein
VCFSPRGECVLLFSLSGPALARSLARESVFRKVSCVEETIPVTLHRIFRRWKIFGRALFHATRMLVNIQMQPLFSSTVGHRDFHFRNKLL